MDMRIPALVMMVAILPLVSAAGTGPTLPEQSREHPLDTREPRQDVIEERGGSQQQPRPATLEAPREVTPTERPSEDGEANMPEATGGAAADH